MDNVLTDLPPLIFSLLPGFLTAWVLYGLTAYRRPSPFERVIQALIFTVIVKVLLVGFRQSLVALGHYVSVGSWTEESSLAWSVVLAILLGVLLSFLANTNKVHHVLWKLGITNGSSFPSEWYKTFVYEKRWVILHLKGNRRLYGWPSDYPDQPDRGHFVITEPEWLLADGTRAPIYQVERLLIPVTDVEMVELLHENSETKMRATDEELKRSSEIMLAVQDKGIADDEKTRPSLPETANEYPE